MVESLVLLTVLAVVASLAQAAERFFAEVTLAVEVVS